MADGKFWLRRLGVRTLLTTLAVAVLITLACGDGTTTAPDTPAPSPIAPPAAPTTVEIAPTVASIPSALSAVNAFFEAFNKGDVGALSSLYSDDVTQTFGPEPGHGFVSISGLAAVLEDNREHIDLHAHYTPSNIRAVGNTVTSQVTYRDEDLEQRGVASLSGSMSFSVEQEKIAAIVITLDEESTQELASVSNAIQPIWSPDGRYIAFQVHTFDFLRDEIYVMRADGTEQTNLTDNRVFDCCPVWSPESGHLAFMVLPEPDGYFRTEIYSMRINGAGQVNLTNDPSRQRDPIWSPDGRHIAFVWWSGIPDIYTMRADGTEQTRLTSTFSAHNFDPVWSPDGSSIAFISTRDGNDELYVMGVDGTEPTNLSTNPGLDARPAWSPDGEFIAFLSDRSGAGDEQDVYLVRADGTELTNLTNTPFYNEGRPAWSPDGSKIAFDSDRNGSPEIYLMNADGSNQTRLTRFSR